MDRTRKLKVGDRVRAIADEDGEGKGKTAVIIEMCHPEWAHVRFDDPIAGWGEDGQEWGFSTSKLVPVAESTGTATDGAQADKPKFKVGDTVRIASGPNNGGFGQIGDTGVIEIVGKTDCLVRYGDGSRSGEAWHVGFDYLEHAKPATFTIQPGKFYITRDGRKVVPMRRWSDEAKHRWEAADDDLPYIWADDGTEIDSDIDDSADLVAEADEPPAEPQSAKEILDELEAWIAEQDAIKAAGKGSTAGFTVPLCAYEDEPSWYAAELGRAYADGYAAGLRAAA